MISGYNLSPSYGDAFPRKLQAELVISGYNLSPLYRDASNKLQERARIQRPTATTSKPIPRNTSRNPAARARTPP